MLNGGRLKLKKTCFLHTRELGNGINVSISINGSDTPVNRLVTGKGVGGNLSAIEILNTVENHEWTIKKKK